MVSQLIPEISEMILLVERFSAIRNIRKEVESIIKDIDNLKKLETDQ